VATLSIRPRRTKNNPFPRRLEPLARWRKENTHYALRADGSVVRRVGSGTWTAIQFKGRAKKGLAVEEVALLLEAAGFRRVGVDSAELERLPY
jgi:hypothetical protein